MSTVTSPNPSRAFAQVTSLFFAWGFVTATIDPLIPSVRAIFRLSFAESMLTQFAFFVAYGVVSLPAAALVGRLGSGRAVVAALATMVLGCLLMPLATGIAFYPAVLVALFVIAAGVTLLQVAANPLAARLGPPDRAGFRLTLAQAFNSLGTVIAPFVGATLMLGGGVFAAGSLSAAQRASSLRAIDTNFLIIAGIVAALALLFWSLRSRLAGATSGDAEIGSPIAAFSSGWALAGAGAIFLYVGAEVSIGSILISFLTQPSVIGVTAQRAGQIISLYWLGAMIGRFGGSALLTRFRAHRLLAIAAASAAVLCAIVSQTGGTVAAVSAVAVGLFNAIMFPTIFSSTLERSSAPAAATSGLLCMAIVGGAIVPLMTGLAADHAGIATAFLVPMTAYAAITLFALALNRASARTADAPIAAPH